MSRRKHSIPEIGYDAALRMFVGYYEKSQVQVCSVAACDGYIFRKMVLRACQTARDPDAAYADLLTFTEDNYERSLLDRWFAMCSLLKHGATPFWSSTYVDATTKHIQPINETTTEGVTQQS